MSCAQSSPLVLPHASLFSDCAYASSLYSLALLSRYKRVLHHVTSGLLGCKDMGWNLVILNQPNREFVSSYR